MNIKAVVAPGTNFIFLFGEGGGASERQPIS